MLVALGRPLADAQALVRDPQKLVDTGQAIAYRRNGKDDLRDELPAFEFALQSTVASASSMRPTWEGGG